ncbi:MAG: hypothetical protein QMD50_03060 [Patescibacteria group bacterium]|nr:hypothetical protein [Patescibacteria group bacterium]
MKQIKFKLFLGFSLVAVFLGVGAYLVKAQTTWLGPTEAFPGGQPYGPLDTSPYAQIKPGPITISNDLNNPDLAIEISGQKIFFYDPRQGLSNNGYIYWNSTGDQKFYVVDGDSSVTRTPKPLVSAGSAWQKALSTDPDDIYVSSTIRVGIGIASPASSLDVGGTGARFNMVGIGAGSSPSAFSLLDVRQTTPSTLYSNAALFQSVGGGTGASYGLQSRSTGYRLPLGANGRNIGGSFYATNNTINIGGQFEATPMPSTVSSTNIAVNILGPLNPSSGRTTNYAIYSGSRAKSYFAGPLCLGSISDGDCKSSWSSILGVTGAGETNYIPFWTSTSAIGTSTIYQSGLNIGIGTKDPKAKLHTSMDTFGDHLKLERTGEYPSYYLVNLSGNKIYQKSDVDQIFQVGGADRLTIRTDGNIGVGLTNPGSKLSVAGGLAVGASYANQTAPVNGAIIEGKVGVGVNDPKYTLQIGGSAGIIGVPNDPLSSALTIGRGEGDTDNATYVPCGPNPSDPTKPPPSACGIDNFDSDNKIPDYYTNPASPTLKKTCNQLNKITGDYNDIGLGKDVLSGNPVWNSRKVHCESVDEPLYTIRNRGGNLELANKDQAGINDANMRLSQNGLLELLGPLAVNTNLNGATTTSEIELTTNVTNSGKGLLTHKISGPTNVPVGSPSRTGALVIGAGGTNNDIFLSKANCTDGICNVPNIYLMANEIKLSENGINSAPLKVEYDADGDGYYAVYAP